jgi:hypothetical protein
VLSGCSMFTCSDCLKLLSSSAMRYLDEMGTDVAVQCARDGSLVVPTNGGSSDEDNASDGGDSDDDTDLVPSADGDKGHKALCPLSRRAYIGLMLGHTCAIAWA